MFQNLTTMFLLTFVFCNVDALPNASKAQLISTYAKVAHWGATTPSLNNPNEARSRSQVVWSQSSKKRPVYTGRVQTSKLDHLNQNPLPSRGEVQERFNPRPYFDFSFDEPSYKKPNKPKQPTIVYGTPVKPAVDSYSSPFNSYNPPEFKPEAVPIIDFPPNNSSSTTIPKPPPNFPDTFHPPLSPPAQAENEEMEPPEKEPAQEEEDHLEPPPNFHYHHHAPKHPSMVEEDLAPPSHGKFPPQEYLDHKPEDFYHFNHYPVYHEVKPTTTTTTTTIKPRAGHYSYYYLGRKLFYIPLYFSVYFIIYVTILILKSIARHKIQFSHNFDKGRSGREVDYSYADHTVVDAVENVNKKFM